MSASRAFTSIRAARPQPISTYLGRRPVPSSLQVRTITQGKEAGDLGGPGGQEDPFARKEQNRNWALYTGGAVVAAGIVYYLVRDDPKKTATKSLQDVAGKGESGSPAARGLNAHRNE